MPGLLLHYRSANDSTGGYPLLRDRDARSAYGCRGERVFTNASDPAETLVLLEWDNLDRARLYAESDELREALIDIGGCCIWILDDPFADTPVTYGQN